MMFKSMAVLFLNCPEGGNKQPHQSTSNSLIQTGKFNKLLSDIRNINYMVHCYNLNEGTELEQNLTEYLKLHDIVITIGCLTETLLRAVATVYDENLADDIQETKKEMNQNTETAEYKHFQIIEEQQNHILKLHRFYFIDSECLDDDFNQLLKQFQRFTQKVVYSKVFCYNKTDKHVVGYVNQLVLRRNGIKSMKLNESQVVVSSRCIEDIIAVQEHFVSNYKLENSFVLEEYEEEILNSPCVFIQEAIKYIKECFDIYKPENVFISFNGGKDCTVLLHLMMIVLWKFFPAFKQKVFCLYIQSKKPFPQVTKFIDKAKTYYNLDIHTMSLGIKDGLTAILQERPNLKACLMGTRRSDPFCAHLHHFQATDNDWPELMRVSPLLDWEFAHIWDYLLSFKVPYCCLYDYGYTSLGNVDNTLKNPQLLNEETSEYYPAYRLLMSNKERSGRM